MMRTAGVRLLTIGWVDYCYDASNSIHEVLLTFIWDIKNEEF